MVTQTFLVGSLITLIEGLSYVLVGTLLARRVVPAEGRLAAILFRWWWYLIGANKIAAAASGLLAAYQVIGAPGYVAVIYLNVIVLAVSLACLLSFFVYLVSGSTRGIRWVVGFYAAYYLYLTYHIAAAEPIGVGFGAWRSYLVNAVNRPAITGLPILVGLVVPQTIAAIVYIVLALRVAGRDQRFRMLLVSLSILAWTVSILLVSLPGFNEDAGMQIASRVIGLASGAASLLAYAPPQWLRRQLHLAGRDAQPQPMEGAR